MAMAFDPSRWIWTSAPASTGRASPVIETPSVPAES